MDSIPRSAFEKTAEEQSANHLLGELWNFLQHTKKWWLVPILTILLLLGVFLLLSASAAAPFIYTLF